MDLPARHDAFTEPGAYPGPPGPYGDDGLAIDRATECFRFLRGVPILLELDDNTLWDLARSAQPRSFEPGEKALFEGRSESSANFYIIRSGSADVLRRDRIGRDQIVARLSVGSYFGELGLLTDQARNASISVHGSIPLKTYEFDAVTFHRRIAEHVLVFRALRERGERTSMQLVEDDGMEPRGLRLSQLDFLSKLPMADLDEALQHAERRVHPDRSEIIHQGDHGDRFYVLLEGSVSVIRDGRTVALLEPGDFFGETALLLDTPRSATIAARRPAVTWSIPRTAFQRLVGGYLMSNQVTQEEIVRRMRVVLPETAGEPTADQ